MGSLVSHRAALESRGGGKLRRPLLKGKGSHDPSHGWPPRLGTSNLLQSALALLLGAIKLCSAWAAAKQVEVHAPNCQSWASAGSCAHGALPYLGTYALPLREQMQTGQDCQGARPWLWGLAAQLDPKSLLGLSSAQGAALWKTGPTWKGDARCEGPCWTHLPAVLSISSSASWADSAIWVQSFWIHLGESYRVWRWSRAIYC